MYGTLLFTIPIYLRSLDKNVAANERKREQFIEEIMSMQHLLREEYEQDFNRRYWLPWQYTEIIGYVELRHVDEALKAYYWFVDATRLSPQMRHKTFRYVGKLIDVSENVNEKTSEEIVSDIRGFLADLPCLRRRFRAHYFDTSVIERILNFVDFTQLLAAHE